MLEALSPLWIPFAALGFLGMAIVGACALAAIAFSFAEKGWAAFLFLAAALAAVAFFSGANPFAAVAAHPFAAIGWALAYLAAGSAWSIGRFWLYASGLKLAFRDLRDQWLSKNSAASLSELTPEQTEAFREHARHSMAILARYGRFPVSPSEHKAEILFWMGWWPVSMLAYALDEPIRRLLDALYRTFSGVYARIAARESSEYLEAMGKRPGAPR